MSGGSPVFRSALILALVIGALSLFDRFLAQTEMAEVQREASQDFASGSRLLSDGKAPQAVELLRSAHVLERQKPEYELQLGDALLAAGKVDEAQPLIDETLQRQPNDGRTNLIAARLMAEKQMPSEAKAYYHRAIYGNWPAGGLTNKIAARVELIEFLIRGNNRAELLPELISLEEEPSSDTGLRKRLAHYFMIAGAPIRAAAVDRDLIARNPGDAAAYASLGEAELEGGQYRAARFAFLKAFSVGRDPAVLPRLELVNTLTGLDPTPRQLPSIEKYRRSVRLLSLVCDDLRQHPSDGTTRLLKEADEALSKKEPAHASNELAETMLALAEKLWLYRIKTFGPAVPLKEESLGLIMEKLAA